MDDSRKIIRCNEIPYRSGYIEIANIHTNCVNIETWEIGVDSNVSEPFSDPFPQQNTIANCEIEMTVDETKSLILLLQNAVSVAEEQS